MQGLVIIYASCWINLYPCSPYRGRYQVVNLQWHQVFLDYRDYYMATGTEGVTEPQRCGRMCGQVVSYMHARSTFLVLVPKGRGKIIR